MNELDETHFWYVTKEVLVKDKLTKQEAINFIKKQKNFKGVFHLKNEYLQER